MVVEALERIAPPNAQMNAVQRPAVGFPRNGAYNLRRAVQWRIGLSPATQLPESGGMSLHSYTLGHNLW